MGDPIFVQVGDPIFEHRRLATIYDALDRDRHDLDAYIAVAEELAARRVLDIGCGTGTFALLLADRGFVVTGLDPASASLDVAKAKPGAERVTWICGDASSLPSMQVDLATMTGNVAQAIGDPADWHATLQGAYTALRPGGHLVFETRDPARRAWEDWNPSRSRHVTVIPGVDKVDSWYEVIDVSGPLITFRGTWVFASDGQVLTSESMLRFRTRDEIEASLTEHAYVVREVRDAPDRPGLELVFLALRPECAEPGGWRHKSGASQTGSAAERDAHPTVPASGREPEGTGRSRRGPAGPAGGEGGDWRGVVDTFRTFLAPAPRWPTPVKGAA